MVIHSIIFGDLHFPFHSKSALTKALDFLSESKPKYIIQIGDLYDFWSLSRFPKAQSVIKMTPWQEMELARTQAEEFWRIAQKRSPKSNCIQILGNHDARLHSRILEKLPEILGIVDIQSLFKFDGVKTQFDIREELIIDDICFLHGFFGTPGQHMAHNMMNTVLGHTHRGWVHHAKIRGQQIWELNAGYLADPTTAALSYTKQRWTRWTPGLGIIFQDKSGRYPAFMPIEVK